MTTTPSEPRTPPQLPRASSRCTPRASKALPREINRRRPFAFFADTASRLPPPLGRERSASSHSATTSCSPRSPALARSCWISCLLRLPTRSRVQAAERRALNASLPACITDPLLKDSEARDQQEFAGEPGLRVAYSLMYHIFGPKSQRIVRPWGIKVFHAGRRPAQASYWPHGQRRHAHHGRRSAGSAPQHSVPRRDGERRAGARLCLGQGAQAPHPHPRRRQGLARDLALRPDPRPHQLPAQGRAPGAACGPAPELLQEKVIPWADNGSARTGLPPSARIAFASAGAITGVAGSPTPLGFSFEATMWTSTRGIWLMRSTG